MTTSKFTCVLISEETQHEGRNKTDVVAAQSERIAIMTSMRIQWTRLVSKTFSHEGKMPQCVAERWEGHMTYALGMRSGKTGTMYIHNHVDKKVQGKMPGDKMPLNASEQCVRMCTRSDNRCTKGGIGTSNDFHR
jgi:hypothetical protein